MMRRPLAGRWLTTCAVRALLSQNRGKKGKGDVSSGRVFRFKGGRTKSEGLGAAAYLGLYVHAQQRAERGRAPQSVSCANIGCERLPDLAAARFTATTTTTTTTPLPSACANAALQTPLHLCLTRPGLAA